MREDGFLLGRFDVGDFEVGKTDGRRVVGARDVGDFEVGRNVGEFVGGVIISKDHKPHFNG